MSLWSRIGSAVQTFVAWITGAPESEPPEPALPPSPGGDYGDRDYGIDYGATPERSLLPDGWHLVGLYHDGEKTTRIDATDDTVVTDNDIAQADALIVWYEDAGADGYRWVHGAGDWESLADQIETTIIIVSPMGRGR